MGAFWSRLAAVLAWWGGTGRGPGLPEDVVREHWGGALGSEGKQGRKGWRPAVGGSGGPNEGQKRPEPGKRWPGVGEIAPGWTAGRGPGETQGVGTGDDDRVSEGLSRDSGILREA